jgi:hypothetical protein
MSDTEFDKLILKNESLVNKFNLRQCITFKSAKNITLYFFSTFTKTPLRSFDAFAFLQFRKFELWYQPSVQNSIDTNDNLVCSRKRNKTIFEFQKNIK